MLDAMVTKAVLHVGRSVNKLKLKKHVTGGEYGAETPKVTTIDDPEANLIGSAIFRRSGGKWDGNIDVDRHYPVIDLDFPAYLIPSSTPGHFHLYLEKELSFDKYERLLEAMVVAGLVERGFADQLRKHGQTYVRMPSVKKEMSDVLKA